MTALNQLRAGLTRYLKPDQLERLASARVGIAGAGGLGSNAAMLLARSGIEKMVIADHDSLDASNLNRQHYWPEQIGMPKVQALACHLRQLNPDVHLTLIEAKIERHNLANIITLADIWVEALDGAQEKKMLVEEALRTGCNVAAASGIAGYGGKPMGKRYIGRLTLVGDFETDICTAPPLAPRVAQAAGLLADCVLEFILGKAS